MIFMKMVLQGCLFVKLCFSLLSCLLSRNQIAVRSRVWLGTSACWEAVLSNLSPKDSG